MKKLFILFLALFTINSAQLNAQKLDNIGIRAGTGYSYQYWDYTQPEFTWVSGYKESQRAIELYVTSEIRLNKYFSIKPELGYSERGFYGDKINTDIIIVGGSFTKNTVEIRNVSFNLGLKSGFFILKKIYPYILGAIKTDHLIGIDDWDFNVNGNDHHNYHDFIFKDYRSLIFSGIISTGIEWNNLIYIEYQYNLPFESSTKDNPIRVKDYYHGISIGIKISFGRS